MRRLKVLWWCFPMYIKFLNENIPPPLKSDAGLLPWKPASFHLALGPQNQGSSGKHCFQRAASSTCTKQPILGFINLFARFRTPYGSYGYSICAWHVIVQCSQSLHAHTWCSGSSSEYGSLVLSRSFVNFETFSGGGSPARISL